MESGSGFFSALTLVLLQTIPYTSAELIDLDRNILVSRSDTPMCFPSRISLHRISSSILLLRNLITDRSLFSLSQGGLGVSAHWALLMPSSVVWGIPRVSRSKVHHSRPLRSFWKIIYPNVLPTGSPFLVKKFIFLLVYHFNHLQRFERSLPPFKFTSLPLLFFD